MRILDDQIIHSAGDSKTYCGCPHTVDPSFVSWLGQSAFLGDIIDAHETKRALDVALSKEEIGLCERPGRRGSAAVPEAWRSPVSQAPHEGGR